MSLTVYPVPGRTLLLPERAWAAVPPEGATVVEDVYITRALAVGDITLAPPVAPPVAPVARVAKVATES